MLCLFAAIDSGCTKHEPPTAARPQILRLSQRNEPADLDPATATLPDEFYIIGALGEGLLVPDPGRGSPLPGAAERYEVSADGLSYTFHLRAGAVWSNGEPVTAADFVSSYQRLLTPATAAPKADLFFAVKNAHAFATGALTDFSAVGFHAADPQTLVITLAQPHVRFPYYVASGPWIPVNPRVVAQFGRQWTQPGHHVGNGIFTLRAWRAKQRIVVQKNPRYRAAAAVQIDELDFVQFDSGETEERAFRAGQIDVTVSIPNTKIAVYARDRPAELHRASAAETRFLSFNTDRPALADPRVRRALSLVIDRAKLVERVTLGGQQPAWRLLPPLLAEPSVPPPAPRPSPSPLAAELAVARQLLAEAGFPAGKNFPRLELTAWSPSQTPVLEALQAMWRQELGLDIAVAIREGKVHLAALPAGDYDIAFATTIPLLDVDDPVALFASFTAASPNNFPRWSDPAYDRLIAAATAALDPTAQFAQLAQAETILLEAVPVAPIYFNTRTWLMSPRVHGWQEDALWTRSYLKLSVDEK